MKRLTIGLFGFGRTGSAVAKEIINDEGLELCWVMGRSNQNENEFASHLVGIEQDEGKIYSIQHVDLKKFYVQNPVDVIVDFSSSCSVNEYKWAAQYGIRVVSAISNYSSKEFEQLKKLSKQTAVLYSPNITIGVNFLIEASKLLKRIIPNADIEIIEEHFRDKRSRSGTALRIADDLELDKEEHVKSIRVGGIIGTHEVIFGLPNQTIRIKHESLNRAAFGQGAIYAAKWIMSKEKDMYSMEEAVASFMQQV